MRVGILTYGLDRSPAGIGRYAVDLVRTLRSMPKGPDVVLLTTEQNDTLGLWQEFEHYRLPGCHLLPALLTIGNIVLSGVAKRQRLDLIHDPNGIGPFLGPHFGIKRVVTIHDVFAFAVPATHNRLDNWRYRYMLPRALRNTDSVITISQWSKHDIERFLPVASSAIDVIPRWPNRNFVPVTDIAALNTVLERYRIEKPFLLYVGGINARKNIARLFEAYALVRERHPGVKLVVGGKRQWQTGAIDEVFERLNLQHHVHFTGYVADADLPALYSSSQAFVFPSLYEGFGLPPLEAMACGTPVITSNASSLPEVVGDAAITVDPHDINGLADAMHRVLSDQELRDTLRLRGLSRVTEFTAEREAAATLAVYERVLNGA